MGSIFRNTLAQSSSLTTAFFFSLLLAPIMLSRLGIAAFGVWAVTGALAQYFRLLDFGITSSLSRFVALYDAQGDRRAIEELVGVGLFAASCVGLAMFAAAALTAPLVSDVLGVLDADEMRLVLISAAGITLSYLFGAVIAAVPIGLRRMGPPNVAAILGNLANFVFSVVALVLSTELVVYALANLAAAILGLAIVAASLLWVWERPFARPPTVQRGRTVLSFGVKSQLVTLADLVNLQTDKLIIAAMLGPSVAGAYELANRAVQGALSFGTMTLSALIPTATADIVERGRQVIVEYFTRYSVRSLSIALPLFGTLCVSAPYLFVLWLGEVPHDADQIVVLLSFAFAINMTTGVPMTLSVSDGHPGLVAQTAVVLVVLNITLTAAAAPIFGLWGVLLGTVAAQLVASGIFLLRFRRRYAVRASAFRAAFVEPTAVAVLVAVPFALWYALGGPVPESRAPALLGAAATGGVYALACWLIESHRGLLPEKLRVGWLRQRLARPAKVPG
jgi:O-antigen/teichoic acid export membrane protein